MNGVMRLSGTWRCCSFGASSSSAAAEVASEPQTQGKKASGEGTGKISTYMQGSVDLGLENIVPGQNLGAESTPQSAPGYRSKNRQTRPLLPKHVYGWRLAHLKRFELTLSCSMSAFDKSKIVGVMSFIFGARLVDLYWGQTIIIRRSNSEQSLESPLSLTNIAEKGDFIAHWGDWFVILRQFCVRIWNTLYACPVFESIVFYYVLDYKKIHAHYK